MCQGYVAKCVRCIDPDREQSGWGGAASGAPVLWTELCESVLAGGGGGGGGSGDGPWQSRCSFPGGPVVLVAPVAWVPLGVGERGEEDDDDGTQICSGCASGGLADVDVPGDIGDSFAWAHPAAAAAANVAAPARRRRKTAVAKMLRERLVADWTDPPRPRELPPPAPDPDGDLGERKAALVAAYIKTLKEKEVKKEDRGKPRRHGRKH